jgi:long-chain acyl-CoA synthetase
MSSNDALLDAWEKTRRDLGEAPAIFDVRGRVTRTFSGIEERARCFAREIEVFAPGEVVGIQIGNHPDWPSRFLACLRRGAIVLPLEQSITEQERNNALNICGAAGLISAPHIAVESGSAGILPAIRRILRRTSDRSAGCQTQHAGRVRSPSDLETIDWGENPPVLLKLTSGTTAVPRAVRFRSEQLLADCENICDTMGITARDLNYGVIPISHSYGFSNLLTPLLTRGVPMALSADRMPRAIIEGIAATRATVFPGMPVFYQSFCEMSDPPALPDLRLCISAGAPLTVELAQQFRERLGFDIHSYSGSSE